ncbi:hypothetical protein C8R44DRAFT_726549 [Mycena epipterygia]|nr:hypothetical protein C8R44DRAFT_726549 [Mycena epipterygia]
MFFTPAASLNISSSVSDCGHVTDMESRSTLSPLEFATTPSPLSAGSSLASLCVLSASIGAIGASTLSSLHSHPIEEIWDLFFTHAESFDPNSRTLPSSDMRDLISS